MDKAYYALSLLSGDDDADGARWNSLILSSISQDLGRIRILALDQVLECLKGQRLNVIAQS